MLELPLKIINELGLHARAASSFVQLASRFQSDIKVTLRGNTINGKSILGLMMLEATQGSVITLRVEGPDEAQAVKALSSLINHSFGEES
ncbi:MAG: HPr family phosphocarrier protein [Neisseriaceae bacterium]